ncbi:MAG: JAB domain-containing protein [Rhodocyclaceae bacterium]|nr:JAB domain-containing protein [Rhodocyclaceae bacterium]
MSADDKVIRQALGILESRMSGEGMLVASPLSLMRHAYLELAQEPNEVKLGYWIGAGNRLLGWDRIAYGGEVSVSYSLRHTARLAIAAGATGAFFLHNHPSGPADPSPADIEASLRMDKYLASVDVLVLGHFVLAGDTVREVRSYREFKITESEYSGPRCPHCNWRIEGDVNEHHE